MSDAPRPEPTKEELEDLKKMRLLETLVRHEGWAVYIALLSKHINDKVNELVRESPSTLPDGRVEDGVSALLRGERAKGAILGLRLAKELPHGIVETQLKPLRKKLFGSSSADED